MFHLIDSALHPGSQNRRVRWGGGGGAVGGEKKKFRYLGAGSGTF